MESFQPRAMRACPSARPTGSVCRPRRRGRTSRGTIPRRCRACRTDPRRWACSCRRRTVVGLAACRPRSSADVRLLGSQVSPVLNGVVVPARHAYSHSASVGRRYGLPSFFDSHSQKATACCQLTNVTGSSSPCDAVAAAELLVLGSNCSYWALVTSGRAHEERLGDLHLVGRRFVAVAAFPFLARFGRRIAAAHDELAGLDAHQLHADRVGDRLRGQRWGMGDRREGRRAFSCRAM